MWILKEKACRFIKKTVGHKSCGAIDNAMICIIIILCLIMITFSAVQLRIAQSMKFELDQDVSSAATSAYLLDRYQDSSEGENALDCTGNGNSDGAYKRNPYDATKKACQIAYERFENNLIPALGNFYIKSVKMKEFIVINRIDGNIYSCVYDGNIYQEPTISSDIKKMVKGNERVINQSSIFVNIEFVIEIFGKEYVVPITEYVYGTV